MIFENFVRHDVLPAYERLYNQRHDSDKFIEEADLILFTLDPKTPKGFVEAIITLEYIRDNYLDFSTCSQYEYVDDYLQKKMVELLGVFD